MSVNIVKTSLSREATLFEPEGGGRVRRWARHILRRLRLIPPRQVYSLFQRNMAAYRFETDDGRVSIVPLACELVDDPGVDAEAIARGVAMPALEVASVPAP